jgi:hypothetical protein
MPDLAVMQNASNQRCSQITGASKPYDTDLGAAFELVQLMRAQGWKFYLDEECFGWVATFSKPIGRFRSIVAAGFNPVLPQAIVEGFLDAHEQLKSSNEGP